MHSLRKIKVLILIIIVNNLLPLSSPPSFFLSFLSILAPTFYFVNVIDLKGMILNENQNQPNYIIIIIRKFKDRILNVSTCTVSNINIRPLRYHNYFLLVCAALRHVYTCNERCAITCAGCGLRSPKAV